MTELYKDVISAIQAKKCEVHDQHPFIGISDGKIVLLTCCTGFKLACYKEMIILLNDHKKNNLTVAWKKPAR